MIELNKLLTRSMIPPAGVSVEELPLRLPAAAAALLLPPNGVADFVEDFVEDCEVRGRLVAAEDRLLAPRVKVGCLLADFVVAFVLARLLAEAAPFLEVADDRAAGLFDLAEDDAEFLDSVLD